MMESADRKKGNKNVGEAAKSLLKHAGLCVQNGGGHFEQKSVLLADPSGRTF